MRAVARSSEILRVLTDEMAFTQSVQQRHPTVQRPHDSRHARFSTTIRYLSYKLNALYLMEI